MKALALALLLPGVALAQTQQYLPEPTIAAAQARSVQQCAALGCDGVHTKYWWQTTALQDGTAALRIEAAGSYSRTTGTAGLTPTEQAALVPYATECGNRLLAWCIATADFGKRFTAAQIAELDAAPAPCRTDWAALKINPVTDLLVVASPFAAACSAQGFNYAWGTILAPVPVAAVPP